MASSILGQTPAPASTIKIWITRPVERDYRRRNVFPALRIETAFKLGANGVTGIYRVSKEDAESVLKDAEAQHETMERGVATRGLRHAYTSLIDRTQRSINSAGAGDVNPSTALVSNDATPPPGQIAVGFDAWIIGLANSFMSAYEASPARFVVGDKAVFYFEDTDSGVDVEIVKAYGPHDVEDSGLRLGYVVLNPEDGASCFARASDLREADFSVRHLRLVVKAPEHRAPEYRGPERRRSTD